MSVTIDNHHVICQTTAVHLLRAIITENHEIVPMHETWNESVNGFCAVACYGHEMVFFNKGGALGYLANVTNPDGSVATFGETLDPVRLLNPGEFAKLQHRLQYTGL